MVTRHSMNNEQVESHDNLYYGASTFHDPETLLDDCEGAIVLIDKMGLYALTEIVMDPKSFTNLVSLFSIQNMQISSSMAQKRILKKITDTLTRK